MFADAAHVEDDLTLLERLRVALRAAPRINGQQRLRSGGEMHRIAVPDWVALSQGRAAVGVGFFGQARADVDHAPISLMEDEIVERAASLDGLLVYHNALLEAGRWANLVAFESVSAVDALRGDAVHEAAVTLTPVHYASLRLHRGVLADGVLGLAPFALERTLFFDFSEVPRRFVRTAERSA